LITCLSAVNVLEPTGLQIVIRIAKHVAFGDEFKSGFQNLALQELLVNAMKGRESFTSY
jgi:hypothetical protein